MRVVAVLNQKGGVGKTTTAVNLGAALALRDERVLLVDLDPQGNLTDHLGLEAGDEAPTAYEVLAGEGTLAAATRPTATPNLWVVPSHEDLAAIELELAETPGREMRLKQALAAPPADAYDWVLIDCPPALGLLSLNALAAADEVFITLQTEYFALRGLSQLDRIVEMVRAQINPALAISGILPTLVDPVTNLAREVLEEVKRVYGHRVFATRIRKNVRLAEAPGHRQHIFAYAPTSAGAVDYHALADEVLALEASRAPTGSAPGAAASGRPARKRVPVAIPVEDPRKPSSGTPVSIKPPRGATNPLPRADEVPRAAPSPHAAPPAAPAGPSGQGPAEPPAARPARAAPPAAEPSRPAVPSPALRNPRPWMKPGPGA